ncbi:MAG: amidophosphoribosyltransferase [Saprospiraceae bacterium]|nr:amidophosphoribosyltransferase [Saprospiraceae bacterium]
MSDQIKHECGLAFVRLLKPVEYYAETHGNPLYGLQKVRLLMQKMRNRGQDGAGLATIKLNVQPGKRYISRRRSVSSDYLKDLFSGIYEHFSELPPEQLQDAEWLYDNMPYTGELLMGHLRYGTHGDNSIETCHPFLRQNNWITRNLVLAGNFNMTNVDELFNELVELGQYPKQRSDTVTVMEKIGHFLDDEVQRLYTWFKPDGYDNKEINELIFEHLDIQRLLRRASRKFDGGYVIAGMIGHGDAFVIRDPSGIRPAFYYRDEEVVVAASERPAIQTALNVKFDDVRELLPGHALIIKRNGHIEEVPFTEPRNRAACSFERIYFSRGTDREIYQERKKLGELLAPRVLEEVGYDVENTVFSFVPNTAESAFFGLIEGIDNTLNQRKIGEIQALGPNASPGDLARILNRRARVEKLVVKDAKLRTFISADQARGELVSHVYDVTYGIVRDGIDTAVLLDDSIVRGTTLQDSLITIVARLNPKRIIIVSSAPQIRYPDCYGIDMSKMGEFVAFRALVNLLRRDDKIQLLDQAYERCKFSETLPLSEMQNEVRFLFDEYSAQEISDEIARIVTPKGLDIPVTVIYQTLENLHEACPLNKGDWYFSGLYPTPGGNRVINRAFMNYMEKKNVRAY